MSALGLGTVLLAEDDEAVRTGIALFLETSALARPARGRRSMSAAQRKQVSARMRKYWWAERREAKGNIDCAQTQKDRNPIIGVQSF